MGLLGNQVNHPFRYLSDNFPKIHALTDSKGRTALHYAAAAESGGGNYYNIISNAVGGDKGFNLMFLIVGPY